MIDFPNQATTTNDKAVFPMETIFYVLSTRTTQWAEPLAHRGCRQANTSRNDDDDRERMSGHYCDANASLPNDDVVLSTTGGPFGDLVG